MTDHRPAWSRDSQWLHLPTVPGRDFSPEWAFAGSTGAGVRVAVVDSGIEADHPTLGNAVDTEASVQFRLRSDGGVARIDGPHDDVYGHGTACAGIIHTLAPEATLVSVRVIDEDLRGRAAAFHAGLEWAVEEGFDVINLSLGAAKREWALAFHDVCDRGYFANSFIVTAANNVRRDSFPSLFASVTSVASNTANDPLRFHANPEPPTEFLARGIDVEVPWLGGTTITTTGNSFAAAHVAAFAALIKAKHPQLRPFQIKTALWAASANVRAAGTEIRPDDDAAPVTASPLRPTIRSSQGLQPRSTANAGPHWSTTGLQPDATVERERMEIQTLLTDYDVGDLVDRGPWGPVWAARHEGRSVAIRRLDPGLASDDTMRERFAASVRIAASLRHPHVLPILDLRQGDGFAATVMPLCPSNLASRLTDEPPLTIPEAGAAALSLLYGLHEAHTAGVYHGDLRPQNALIDDDGRVVVSDVGLAAALSSDVRTSSALGDPRSLAYLAPEQLEGTAIGGYTDVHAVGLILCELLTGETPWPRVSSLGELVRQRATGAPRPVGSLGSDLAPALTGLLDQATATDPVARPGTVRELADRLEEVMAELFGAGWAGTQSFVLDDDVVAAVKR